MTSLAILVDILRLFSQLALKFHWVKMCFFQHLWHYKLHLNRSVMPKPVFLLTVQEAHKEYGSLTDQIRAKFEQLDSGEFGSPGTPAFDAEACELANLLARVSQLCQRLNLPMPKELYRSTFFNHWRHFSDQNLHRQAVLVRVWRMQLCSHRYELLGCWVPFSFKNWGLAVCLACNHPCSWQVQEINKAACSDWQVVKS